MAVDVETCSLVSSHGARRSAARKALLFFFLFLGSIFFGSSPPSAGAPPRRLSILLWSLCPPFTVFRGCAPVFSHPPQLICGSRSDTAQPERTLVGRSSPDRRLIRSTPPPFPTPLTPFSFFLDTPTPQPTPPYPTTHIIGSTNAYAH